jgi:hypothetical protein
MEGVGMGCIIAALLVLAIQGLTTGRRSPPAAYQGAPAAEPAIADPPGVGVAEPVAAVDPPPGRPR